MDVSVATMADLSIFNNLPPELLSLIFIATLPTILAASDIQPLSAHSSPLNISQASRIWRTIALRTPQLWTQIHFDMAKQTAAYSIDDVLRSASAIPVFMERSTFHPLFINVDTFPRLGSAFVANFWTDSEKREILARTIVRPLLQSRHRWKVARVTIFPQFWQFGYDSNCSGHDGYDVQWSLDNMLLVEELSIIFLRRFEWMRDLTGSRNDPFVVDISGSTYLRRFALEDEFFNELRVGEGDLDAGSPRFPHLQEVHLSIGRTNIPFATVYRLLASSPSLQKAILHLPLADVDTNAHSVHEPNPNLTPTHPHSHPLVGSLYLPHLESLRLQTDHPSSFVPQSPSIQILLSRLSAPSLREMEIVAEDMNGVVLRAAEMLLRSTTITTMFEHGLMRLVLTFDTLTAENLARLLEVTPNLEDLEVRGLRRWMRNGQDIVKTLVRHATGTRAGQGQGQGLALCPKLHALTLSSIDVEDCADTIVEMLLCRSDVLQRLVLTPHCYKGGLIRKRGGLDPYLNACRALVQEREEMRALCGRGLRIDVDFRNEAYYWND